MKIARVIFWLCCAGKLSVNALSRDDPIDEAHLPQFFVIGGQKCGTSSVWEYLKDHPQFILPYKKESFIFANNVSNQTCVTSTTPEEAREELHEKLWLIWEDWMSLQSTSGLTTGEMSTTHMSCGCCIDSIRLLNPNAKIIAILRDPASRTKSRFQEQKYKISSNWKKQILRRRIRSLEELAVRDSALIRDCLLSKSNPYSAEGVDCVQNFTVLGFSMYDIFLPHIYNSFPESNILIIYTENIARNATKEILKLEAFLGIDPWIPDNIDEHYNVKDKYGWQVPSTRPPRKKDALHEKAEKELEDRQHEIYIREHSEADSLSELYLREEIRIGEDGDEFDQGSKEIYDDSIGPAVCKALQRTYDSMADFARRGWIPPLPSEWHCP